jgi:hypothetical protein
MSICRSGRGRMVAIGIIASTAATMRAGDESPADASAAPPPVWEKNAPVTLNLNYTLASDYIWRGINFSEYPGEGREDLNHQITTAFAIETPIGTVGASGWFEWFQGQEHLNPDATNHLQEIDYTLFWNHAISPIGTTIEFGWIAYTFPHLSAESFATYEFYGKASLDDSVIFGVPIVKPFAYWGFDYDNGHNGSWIQVGGSHDFKAADVSELSTIPFVKDLTVTPSLAVAFDWRYLNYFAVAGTASPHRKVANITYGLGVTYDLGNALNLSKRSGSVAVGGFLNYSQAVERDLLNDELYGGATLAYSW